MLNLFRKKILIIEDEGALRNAMVKKFTKARYVVESVASGGKIIGAVQLFKPDLIVLDIMLPRLSGVEALKIIRGEHMRNDVPIIVLSNANPQGNQLKEIEDFNAIFLEKANTSLDDLAQVVKENI